MTRLVTLVALAVAACDTGVDQGAIEDGDAAPVSPDCMEATAHSDLPWIQDNVFTPACANSPACHTDMALSAAGVSLDDGMAESNLVDVIATSAGLAGMGLVLVSPGDPAGSHLMVIMDHESKGGRRAGALPTTGTMPFGIDLVCVQKLDAVERWIASLSQ